MRRTTVWLAVLAAAWATAGRADEPEPDLRRGQRRLGDEAQRKPGDEKDAPWLGVAVGPVPKAVAIHLGLKDRGVMVRNVAKGGPADEAGLERYDVLVEADDAPVPAEVEAFIEMIGRRKAGEKVALTVVQGGKRRTVHAALARRPDGPVAYKYDEEDEGLFWRDRTGVSGKIFRKGPHGWEGIGGTDELNRALADILRKRRGWEEAEPFFSEARTRDRVAWTDEGVRTEVERDYSGALTVRRTRRDEKGLAAKVVRYPSEEHFRKEDPKACDRYRDLLASEQRAEPRPAPPRRPLRFHVQRTDADETVVVESTDDGRIAVTRTRNVDGRKETKRREYAGPDELRKQDEPAFDLFREATAPRPQPPGPEAGPRGLDDWRRRVEARTREIDEALRRAKEELERVRREAAERTEELGSRFREAGEEARRRAEHLLRQVHEKMGRLSEPSQEFEVQEDGRIVVHIRKGLSALRMTFRNEDDMAKRRPDLHKQYRGMFAPTGR